MNQSAQQNRRRRNGTAVAAATFTAGATKKYIVTDLGRTRCVVGRGTRTTRLYSRLGTDGRVGSWTRFAPASMHCLRRGFK